jgi:hypothetical protein
MSARDDLAKAAIDWMTDGRTEYQFADDLLEAGWRAGGRIITTPGELDSLPVGSVVRSNWTGDDVIGFVCVRYSDGWHDCIHDRGVFPLGAGGTATLLHEGGTQ